jgi:hypothetical protein
MDAETIALIVCGAFSAGTLIVVSIWHAIATRRERLERANAVPLGHRRVGIDSPLEADRRRREGIARETLRRYGGSR